MAMTPTVLPAPDKFEPSGVSKFVYLPACADIAAPTEAEITAGTDLSPAVSEWDGWTVEGDTIDAPDLATTFTSQVPGRTKSDNSSITFFMDRAGDDVRALLPRDTVGFIVKADTGLISGQPCDVFPVRVISLGKTTKIGDASTMPVMFAITQQPAEDAPLPAAV